jgi:D-alanyl-D-alanine carboxypeptidase
VLPGGSYLQPLAGDPGGRLLVYATGDGHGQAPGQVWLSLSDVAPSGPPPWVVNSALDGDNAAPPVPGEPHRTSLAAPPVVSAGQIAIVDDASGRMLFGVDSDMPEPPASTTKITTALVTLAHVPDLSQRVRITINGEAMAEADGSSIMGLVPGQSLSYTTLLYGLLLPSGNDAAEQLALSVGGTRAQFVQWMNDEVASLGLHDTQFVNPSGLDEDGHDASAHDLAILAREAMKNSSFRTIVGSPSYTGDAVTLIGHNPLLGVYPGTDGIKTGSTDAAGLTMVASATRNGHRIYVVVMHSDDLLADCSALFDWTWSAFGW